MKNVMKKVAAMLLCIAVAGVMTISYETDVSAATATATVTGTVASGTTADTLYLYNSSDGTYTIKLDAETNFEGCKVLTVGKKVTVGLYRGNDAYNHAATVTAVNKTSTTTVDQSASATVTGKVKEKTTDEILYLDTSGGEMIIKLDSSTNLSGCRVIVPGANVAVSVARGTDAYMHALSITSGSTANTTSSATTGTAETPSGTVAITGTPEEKSTADVLYLKTKDGTYQLKVDANTDTSGGFIFTSANTLTAYIYRGSDAWMHAAKVVGTRNNGSGSGGSTTALSGTVESDSTESLLLLKTSDGVMKFKVDTTTSLQGAKGISKGMQVTVNGTVGSDRYWHAVTIATKTDSSSSASSGTTASAVSTNTIAISGTPNAKTKSNELYLDAKDGTYLIKIDNTTDTSKGFMLTTGNKITVDIYRGSDAYMHAAKIVGTRNNGSGSDGNTTAFYGTVEGDSTESLLLLKTNGGVMKFRIDENTTLQDAKVLIPGAKVNVSAATGSDRYWHALTITAK